jgi:hypothetical protein
MLQRERSGRVMCEVIIVFRIDRFLYLCTS